MFLRLSRYYHRNDSGSVINQVVGEGDPFWIPAADTYELLPIFGDDTMPFVEIET